MRFLKNIGPQWFNRFDGYCPQKKTDRQAKYKQTIWYIYVKSGYPGYDWDFCSASTGVNWHMVRILHYLSNNI